MRHEIRLTPRISGLGQKGSCVITFAQSNTFKMVADSSGVFGRRKANCSKVRYTVDSSCKITFDRASGHCDFSAHTCVLLSLLLRLRVLIVGTNKGLPWDTVGAACRLGMNLVARGDALNLSCQCDGRGTFNSSDAFLNYMCARVNWMAYDESSDAVTVSSTAESRCYHVSLSKTVTLKRTA